MDTYKEVFYAAGVPALISTGITLLYLLLKAYQFAVYALPYQAEGGWQRPRQVVVNKSTAQLREKKATKKFMNKYPEIFQTNMAQSSNNPPGTIPLSRGRENICIATRRNAEEHSVEPFVREMQKDCKAEGIDIPKTMMAKIP